MHYSQYFYTRFKSIQSGVILETTTTRTAKATTRSASTSTARTAEASASTGTARTSHALTGCLASEEVQAIYNV